MWMNCPPNLTLFSPDPFISGRSQSRQLWDNNSSWHCPLHLLRIHGSHSWKTLMLHMSCSFSVSYKHKTQTHLTRHNTTLPRAAECKERGRKGKGGGDFRLGVMVRREVALWLFEALQPSPPARSAVPLPLFVFLHMCLCFPAWFPQMSWFNQPHSESKWLSLLFKEVAAFVQIVIIFTGEQG